MNKERMLDLADYIEKQVSEFRFDMGLWTSFTFDYTDADNPHCQTTACLAGWAWIKEHETYLQTVIDDVEIQVGNDPDFWERNPAHRFTPMRPVHQWAIANNIESAFDSSPEREFATEWLELSKEEASELFTASNRAHPYSLWDLYADELKIEADCDCSDWDDCSGEHLIEVHDIHRDAALMMLRKLGSGEWSFDDVR